MLKGQVFSRQLFQNQIFALFINTFLNGKNGVSNNYQNSMAMTTSGNSVTISSGAVCIQGRFLEENTSTTISAGTDTAYCKLVIEIDLDKTNTEEDFEQGAYKIIKGVNSYPNLTQTNIVKNNSGVYQYELARFRNSASGITDFQDMRTFLDFESIYDEIEQHIHDIDDGSLWVLKSGDTMTGALIANEGIIGDVTGNASTATKLATARNIALSGAVSGNANFDGSGNVSITTTQANIAVITGNLDSNGYAEINYPTGFNENNCIILFAGFHGTSQVSSWAVGGNFDSSSVVSGAIPFQATLGSKIKVWLRNILISQDGSVDVQAISRVYPYKIVLMKVS